MSDARDDPHVTGTVGPDAAPLSGFEPFTDDVAKFPATAFRVTEAHHLERVPLPDADPTVLDLGTPTASRRRSWLRRYRVALVGIDLLAACLATVLSYEVRVVGLGGTPLPANYAPLSLVIAAVWIAVVALNGGYDRRFVGVGQQEFERVFRSFLHLTAVVVIFAYGVQAGAGRVFLATALPTALALDLVGRYLLRKSLHARRARGLATIPILVVGDTAAVLHFSQVVRRDRQAGMRVVAACLVTGADDDQPALREAGIPVAGDIDSVVDSARSVSADAVVVVSSGHITPDKLRWITWQLERTDLELMVSPGLVEVGGPRIHIKPVAGLPLLHVDQPEFEGFRRLVKEIFDRVVAAVALLLLSPLMVAIWATVRLTSPGPGFYSHTRVGRNGIPFTMVKFRSMCAGADARLDELAPLNENADGLLFKVKADPRITRVGRLLRRCSLDELPQLVNVLLGQMSLVGPRPPLPAEVAQYPEDVHRRLLVKPGVTGLWQVSGRSDLSWEESVRLDLRYVENWSLALDLMVLWRTAFAVIRRSGAY